LVGNQRPVLRGRRDSFLWLSRRRGSPGKSHPQNHYAAFAVDLTAITQQLSSAAADVRLWHKADITIAFIDVRFRG
jgi:hypothetical protein